MWSAIELTISWINICTGHPEVYQSSVSKKPVVHPGLPKSSYYVKSVCATCDQCPAFCPVHSEFGGGCYFREEVDHNFRLYLQNLLMLRSLPILTLSFVGRRGNLCISHLSAASHGEEFFVRHCHWRSFHRKRIVNCK